ncbi:MAG: hypothetical protein H7Y00_11295 [Fimbriimonadaceae bacterium]|nr:hypothetical protein [Chitinophagales bacterium]
MKGYIRDDDWERSPEKIQFMQNTNTQPIEYTTKHVKEFSVNQNIYESYFVSVNKKSIEVKDLT